MKVNELIKKLKEVEEEYGDNEVVCNSAYDGEMDFNCDRVIFDKEGNVILLTN